MEDTDPDDEFPVPHVVLWTMFAVGIIMLAYCAWEWHSDGLLIEDPGPFIVGILGVMVPIIVWGYHRVTTPTPNRHVHHKEKAQ
jgi:hypothetical protein